jgi:succinoglycan biosynthesis protein ExoL
MQTLETRASEVEHTAPVFASPAPPPAPTIAFFGHDSDESTVIKRARSFQAEGATVIGFMFRRERNQRDGQTEWRNIPFGTTVERNYLLRVPKLLFAILVALRHRGLLRLCDVIYARNLDMLLIAVAAKWLSGARAPVVYEVLDIQRVFLGTGLASRLFRWAERRLLRAASLLVVSAPDFVIRYFQPAYGFDGRWFLLENKLPARAASLYGPPALEALPPGPPWVIGMFGVIRCARSLDILSHVAEQLGDKVRIYLRGILSEPDIPRAHLDAICRRLPNVTFDGPYVNPRDLPEIYGKIHFIWAADFLDPGGNSDWLLTNRIYEGGLMGAVLLATRGNATGCMVEREGLGFTLEAPLKESAVAFLRNLGSETFLAARKKVRGADRSLFVDETDTRDLIRSFADLDRVAEARTHSGLGIDRKVRRQRWT